MDREWIFRWWISTIILAAAAGNALAEPEGGFGTIRGRVRSAASGEALADTRVELHSADGTLIAGADTEAGGRFQFVVPAPATYFATTGTFELQPEVWNNIPCSFCDPTTGTPIAVTSGGVVTGINFDLESMGFLSGTITDAATGDPLPFVFVSVIFPPNTQVSFEATDQNGHYRSAPLPAGDYLVRTNAFTIYENELFDDVHCFGPSCTFDQGDLVTVQPATETTDIDFALDRLATISGHIREAGSGNPVTNGQVRLWNGVGEALVDSFLTETGDYSFNVPAGSYFVSVQSFLFVSELYDNLPCSLGPPAGCDPTTGTAVTVTPGATASGIDFELQRLGGISGRVTDAVTGEGIPGGFFGNVHAYDSSGNLVGSGGFDQVGNFLVQGLLPGNYFVTTNTAGYFEELWNNIPCGIGPPGGCDPTTGTPIAVTLGAVTPNIDFGLDPLGGISGQVTDELTGQALTASQVFVFDASGQVVNPVNVNSQGRYSSGPLLPGSYYIGVNDTTDEHFDELFADVPCPDGLELCDPLDGTPVTVSLGMQATVNFGLALGPGLQGTVTEQGSGVPLVGVAVDVFNSDGFYVGSAGTLANGRYQLPLLPGTYHVATDNGMGGLDELWDDVLCSAGPAYTGLCDPLLGQPVTVAPNLPATTGINFALSITPLFADGFEGGDTSAWSLTVP